MGAAPLQLNNMPNNMSMGPNTDMLAAHLLLCLCMFPRVCVLAVVVNVPCVCACVCVSPESPIFKSCEKARAHNSNC